MQKYRRRLSSFIALCSSDISPIYRSFSWHFKNEKSTRYRSFPAISRSNDVSFRRYIAKTIYRRACGTSSRYIASVKYRFSDLSLNQEWLIAIYFSSDISPQRVFLWREMLVYYISFKRTYGGVYNDSTLGQLFLNLNACYLAGTLYANTGWLPWGCNNTSQRV